MANSETFLRTKSKKEIGDITKKLNNRDCRIKTSNLDKRIFNKLGNCIENKH